MPPLTASKGDCSGQFKAKPDKDCCEAALNSIPTPVPPSGRPEIVRYTGEFVAERSSDSVSLMPLITPTGESKVVEAGELLVPPSSSPILCQRMSVPFARA